MVSFPFLLLYFIGRLFLEPGYRSHFSERLGWLPKSINNRGRAGSVWVHAVSVGEVTSVLPLLRQLRERLPGIKIYLSTSTIAGRQTAERQAIGLVDGIFYLPIDLVSCLRPAFNRVRPWLLVIVETELWPNLFAWAKRCGASLAIINGRISDRTWPRYAKWRALFHPVLRLPDLVQVQSQTDYQRYSTLGVHPSALLADANLKYDAQLEQQPLDMPVFGAEQIWIAASTVGPNERGSLQRHSVDEDDLVLNAFEELAREFPKLLLILAPRQPARFEEVAGKLAARELHYVRRSAGSENLDLPGVLLLDTIGELARTYSLADVVFVGGSLAPRGGHNIIEPAAAGVPLIVGPHTQNFAAIIGDFKAAEALIQVRNAAELVAAVRAALTSSPAVKQLGERGRQVVQQKRGVSTRLAERLVPLYHAGASVRQHNVVLRVLLDGLAWLWRIGGAYKRHRGERFAATATQLPVPVISVGGLSVGGVGKTPFTAYLAASLQSLGYSPAILTRGYRRRSRAELLLSPGARVSAAITGDEAQIFLQTGMSPVGIGSDRYSVARQLLKAFPRTGVLLLDDGFQHARMPRNLDIVLLDALDPFGNGEVIPAGRLREPIEALRRADLVVVTRCNSDSRFHAVANQIRRIEPSMPIFQTATRPGSWRNARDGETVELPSLSKVAAFCGLGNPESFWQTLDELPLRVVRKKAFRDHHRYGASDIRHLTREAQQQGAQVMVTTEKDLSNLSKEALAATDLKVLYLPIEMVVTEHAEFLRLVEAKIRK